MSSAWFCAGRLRSRVPVSVARLIDHGFRVLRWLAPTRFFVSDFIRYRYEITDDIPPSSAKLERITDAHMHKLRGHPLYGSPPEATGFRLWDHGLRTAFIWEEHGKPLCVQWFFTSSENELLRTYPTWSGLYLDLSPGSAQAEHLHSFAFGRPGGAATDFMFAAFRIAQSMGIHTMFTHIVDTNWAAHRWAAKTGWKPYGTIGRWIVDLPGIRRFPICLHEPGSSGRHP